MCLPPRAGSIFLKKAMRIVSKSVYWAETAQTEQYMAHDMHAKKGHKAEIHIFPMDFANFDVPYVPP